MLLIQCNQGWLRHFQYRHFGRLLGMLYLNKMLNINQNKSIHIWKSRISHNHPASFLQINDWKRKILHHNLVLICLLVHQGHASNMVLMSGWWLSAALHEGAAWCQGDVHKKKGRQDCHRARTPRQPSAPKPSCGIQSLLFTAPYGAACKPTTDTVSTLLTVNGALFAQFHTECTKPLQVVHDLQSSVITSWVLF